MERFRHGGNIYEELSPHGKWLDFSANINPLGMPDSVRKAILEQMDGLVHYPEPDASKLKQAIARHYEVPLEQMIAGNGASELFYLFFHMERPRRVLIPVPSFSEYERSAQSAGAETVFFPLRAEQGFSIDWECLRQATENVDCVILGNPNNPTGTLLPKDGLEELAELCEKKNCWLVVDESFLDFREDMERYTLRHLVQRYPKLFVIQSLTKFYAIPGLRLGFGIANEELRERMEQGKDVWNVNLLAQYAGIAALSDEDYAVQSREWLREEQKFLAEAMREFSEVEVFEPTVNFMLLKCRDAALAKKMLKGMKVRGILLRDCSNYPGLETGGYLRMAIRNHEENMVFVQAWKEVIREERIV